MNMSHISKAIAGAAAGAAGGAGTMAVTIPPEISAPWWAYLVASGLSAAFSFAAVYFAPANRA